MVDFAHGAPVAGNLDVEWDHGVPRGAPDPGPPIQVHAYDEHTIILRQSKTTHYEAPFLYLLMGNDRAVLFDTGATADPTTFPLRATVDRLLASWQEQQRATRLPPGGRPLPRPRGPRRRRRPVRRTGPTPPWSGTTRRPSSSSSGSRPGPTRSCRFDLGGRVLEVTGIPGHHPASIAVFDPWTGFLLTGDSVYPGRLYAHDMPAFVASAERLVDFAATRPVRHVMGCHIEMTRTPGHDYPIGTTYQPDEPPLQMAPDRLLAVRDGARAATGRPGVHVFGDFLIVNETGPAGACPAVIAAAEPVVEDLQTPRLQVFRDRFGGSPR